MLRRVFSTRPVARLTPLLRGLRRRPHWKAPCSQQQHELRTSAARHSAPMPIAALSRKPLGSASSRCFASSYTALRTSTHRWLSSAPTEPATSGRLATKAKALSDSVRGGGGRVGKKFAAAVRRTRQRPNLGRTLRQLAASGVCLWVLSKGSWGFLDDIQFVQGSKEEFLARFFPRKPDDKDIEQLQRAALENAFKEPVWRKLLNTVVGRGTAEELYTRLSEGLTKLLPLGDATSGNEVQVFKDGDEYLEDVWDAIRNAKRRVWLEVFTIKNDRVGEKTLKLLREAADRGVDVVFIYDYIGSLGFHPGTLTNPEAVPPTRAAGPHAGAKTGQKPRFGQANARPVRADGSVARQSRGDLAAGGGLHDPAGEGGTSEESAANPKAQGSVGEAGASRKPCVGVYNPLFPLGAKSGPTMGRDHRKVIIVDDIGYCGGRNLTEAYGGKKYGGAEAYHDINVKLRGPCVGDLARAVLATLYQIYPSVAAQKELPLHIRLDGQPYEFPGTPSSPLSTGTSAANGTEGVLVQVLRQNVRHELRSIDKAVRIILRDVAMDKCFITTPYFMPRPKLRRDIIKASRNGVDVRILTTGKPLVVEDDVFVNFLQLHAHRHIYGKFLEEGVRIFEDHSALHSKTITVDGSLAVVGSFNFDAWSARRNQEITAAILDRKTAVDLEKIFLGRCKDAREITFDDWQERSTSEVFFDWVCYHIVAFASLDSLCVYREEQRELTTEEKETRFLRHSLEVAFDQAY